MFRSKGGTVKINGRTFTGDVNIVNGQIFENGSLVSNEKAYKFDISIVGDVAVLELASGTVNVTGNVETLRTVSGDAIVTGNINGSVNTVSGHVHAKRVMGDTKTVSGDIHGR